MVVRPHRGLRVSAEPCAVQVSTPRTNSLGGSPCFVLRGPPARSKRFAEASSARAVRSSKLYRDSRERARLEPAEVAGGSRTVPVPPEVVARIRHHLALYTGPDPYDRAFVGPKGAHLRRGNLNSLIRWKDSVAAIGAPGLHFHDLRHTGNMLAASVAGVSTKDLMQRMGHDSMRAALIYQHASAEADMRVSEGLSTRIREELSAASIAGGSHEHASEADRSRPGNDEGPRKLGALTWSGRRESNPRYQLGKLKFYH